MRRSKEAKSLGGDGGGDLALPCTAPDSLPGTARGQSHRCAEPGKTPSLRLERREEARSGVPFGFHGLKAFSKVHLVQM